MFNFRFFGAVLTAFFLFSFCSNDEVVSYDSTLLLGHRGSGSAAYNDSPVENTIGSVRYALEFLDGCEVDIQMSADGTLWLYHDAGTGGWCSDQNIEAPCIPLARDEDLFELSKCRGNANGKLTRLKEVLALLNREDFGQKVLSLDIKGWFEEDCFEGRNASRDYFEKMAAGMHDLVKSHCMKERVIFETNYTFFLDEMKGYDSDYQCFLLAYDEYDNAVEHAVKAGYDGISFNLASPSVTAEKIEYAKRKGLRTQLWTVYNQEHYERGLELKPYALQISGIPIGDLKR